MKRINYSTLLIVSITFLISTLIVSCDRFGHEFAPQIEVDFQTELFTPLQEAFGNITATNVQPVMSFFADDYLHNGQTKTDRESWFINLLQSKDTLSFKVTLLNVNTENDTLARANWRLVATNPFDVTVVDSTFTGDNIVLRSGKWLLKGNRVNCCVVVLKKRVIVESFTYRTCTYCPTVEALLHDMQIQHPNNFTYLEYHVNDEMQVNGNMQIYSYYGYPNPPVVIFQGTTKIIGANPDNETQFNALYNSISNQDSEINFNNLNYSFSEQTLNGTINIDVDNPNIDMNQAKLKFVIIEKESSYNNAAGQPCRNVVKAVGERSLNGINLLEPVSFSLSFNGTLPNDSALVLWVQTFPESFNNNATIYNGIEAPLIVTKKN